MSTITRGPTRLTRSSKTLGAGWRIAERLGDSEVLLVYDLDKRANRPCWRYLDPHTRKRLPLGMRFHPHPHNPIFLPKSNELIYVSYKGITVYDFETKQEEVLVPMDGRSYRIGGMWTHPEDEKSLFYILEKLNPDLSRIRPRTGLVVRMKESKCTLMNLIRGSRRPRTVLKLGREPTSADMDWEHGALFASLFDGDLVRLVRYDLTNGASAIIAKITGSIDCGVSPRNMVMIWGTWDWHIEEIAPNGNRVKLTRFGRTPSFSPDGSKMAFLRMGYQLWLKSGKKKPEMIIAFPKSKLIGYGAPTWCPCNNHFAVNLIVSGDAKTTKHVLATVDVRDKKIALYMTGAFSSWERRIWIPKSVIRCA